MYAVAKSSSSTKLCANLTNFGKDRCSCGRTTAELRCSRRHHLHRYGFQITIAAAGHRDTIPSILQDAVHCNKRSCARLHWSARLSKHIAILSLLNRRASCRPLSSFNETNSFCSIQGLPTIAQLTPASTIQNLFSQALGSCPTKKYAVVLQPGVSSDDYQCTRSTPFLFKLGTSGPGVTKGMFKDVIGPVYHVGLVNTILMDCLHHGIKSVKTLDTSALMLPELDAQTISENVIWAPLPAIEPHLTKEERKVVMRNHDMYIEGLVENYFGGEDYTLFYVTESRHDAEVKHDNFDGQEYQMESEVPLVSHGELAKRALSVLKNSTSHSNQTIVDGPLFDKYQFFSPGMSDSSLPLSDGHRRGHEGIPRLG